MIEVYNYPLSPCGEKVRFALAEKGLRWTDISIDLGAKQNLSADFLRMNPAGLVPVLVWNGQAIVESTVINEFIDETWPSPPLKPDDPVSRARMRMWTKFVDETLHPAWPGIAWPILVRPVWQRRSGDEVEAMLAALIDPQRRRRQERLYREGLAAPDARASVEVVSRTLTLMDKALEHGPWLAGESFSLADLALLPYLFALQTFGLIDLLLRNHRLTARWYAACCGRPAYGGPPPPIVRAGEAGGDPRLGERCGAAAAAPTRRRGWNRRACLGPPADRHPLP